jgi:hypothetical protein
MRLRVLPLAFLLLGFSVAPASPPPADDSCAAFTWDVRHERALFGQPAHTLAAGKAAQSAPTLTTDQLFQLQLKAQPDVTFVREPGKKMPADGRTYAGLARLTLETGGAYRIALDEGLWVDAIANDSLVQTQSFQGRHGCNAPRKIVEFVLPARTPITLQFSGGRTPAVKVTVTRSPTD